MIFYLQVNYKNTSVRELKFHKYHWVTICRINWMFQNLTEWIQFSDWSTQGRQDHSPSHLKPKADRVLYVVSIMLIILQNWNKRWTFIFTIENRSVFLAVPFFLAAFFLPVPVVPDFFEACNRVFSRQ